MTEKIEDMVSIDKVHALIKKSGIKEQHKELKEKLEKEKNKKK